MKKASLAIRHRPQTFADVAGQETVKAVLSRAALEDRPAAAYLFSGTRGVGKTTIARIFAKALNCEHAPAAEPCNQCPQCARITAGGHVDVTEIDGASNNSVEDARALRETVGYAPMDARYKVFIIDEAHMLSRSAFNALLKTLEEPPPRVVFIFATTEAHRFPITIVSRCQHFVFRHLSEERLTEHLTAILRREDAPFEEGAVRIIARRAAGSVRDGMSLMDQVLSLGGEKLTEEAARDVLGLAGRELFERIFDALHDGDCAAAAETGRDLLRRGVDVGFFLRELSGHLRDLFLLRRGGDAILPTLGLPPDEAEFRRAVAPRFGAGHLHAAWQMSLEAQRSIVQNPEPAAALELLLIDMALLPSLLPAERLPERMASLPRQEAPAVPPPAAASADRPAPPAPNPAPTPPAGAERARMPEGGGSGREPEAASPDDGADKADGAEESDTSSDPDGGRGAGGVAETPDAFRSGVPAEESAESAGFGAPAEDGGDGSPDGDAPDDGAEAAGASGAVVDIRWSDFCIFCGAEHDMGRPVPPPPLLKQVTSAILDGGRAILRVRSQGVATQLERQRGPLLAALRAFGVAAETAEIVPPPPEPDARELMEELSRHEKLRPCLEIFRGRITSCDGGGGHLPRTMRDNGACADHQGDDT